MAVLYSLVARGKVVLAEFTSTSGNFPTVVRFMLSVRGAPELPRVGMGRVC